MTLLLNVLWFCFGGGLLAGIIGIPFGFAHCRLAAVCFAPLGKRVIDLT